MCLEFQDHKALSFITVNGEETMVSKNEAQWLVTWIQKPCITSHKESMLKQKGGPRCTRILFWGRIHVEVPIGNHPLFERRVRSKDNRMVEWAEQHKPLFRNWRLILESLVEPMSASPADCVMNICSKNVNTATITTGLSLQNVGPEENVGGESTSEKKKKKKRREKN